MLFERIMSKIARINRDTMNTLVTMHQNYSGDNLNVRH